MEPKHLPSVERVHRLALVNAIRRLDFCQVKVLRGLPGTGGRAWAWGGRGPWAGAIRRQIDSVSRNES